jgi:hypothetical protein
MDGQQTMMNQLLTFIVLDRVLDDGGGLGGDRDVRDMVLPLVLCSSAATSGQGQQAGTVGTTTTGGWDTGGPLQLILLLSLLRRRPAQQHAQP